MKKKSEPVKKRMTQRKVIRNHLLAGGSITSIEAFTDYGITRLSAIIYVLRHKEKIPIHGKWIHRAGKRWVKYQILPAKLKKARQAVSDK